MERITECPECHTPLKRAGQRFCGKCGAVLTDAQPAASEAAPATVSAQQTATRSRGYLTIAVACAAFVAVMAFGLWWFGLRSTSVQSAGGGSSHPANVAGWASAVRPMWRQSTVAAGPIAYTERHLSAPQSTNIFDDESAVANDQGVREYMLHKIKAWGGTGALVVAAGHLVKAEQLHLAMDARLLRAIKQFVAQSVTTVQFESEVSAAARELGAAQSQERAFKRAANAQLRAAHIRPLLG